MRSRNYTPVCCRTVDCERPSILVIKHLWKPESSPSLGGSHAGRQSRTRAPRDRSRRQTAGNYRNERPLPKGSKDAGPRGHRLPWAGNETRMPVWAKETPWLTDTPISRSRYRCVCQPWCLLRPYGHPGFVSGPRQAVAPRAGVFAAFRQRSFVSVVAGGLPARSVTRCACPGLPSRVGTTQ